MENEPDEENTNQKVRKTRVERENERDLARSEKIATLVREFPALKELKDSDGVKVDFSYEEFKRLLSISPMIREWSHNYDLNLKETQIVPDKYKRFGLKKKEWESFLDEERKWSEMQKSVSAKVTEAKKVYNEVLQEQSLRSKRLYVSQSVLFQVMHAGTRLLTDAQLFQLSLIADEDKFRKAKVDLIDKAIQDWIDSGNLQELPEPLKLRE